MPSLRIASIGASIESARTTRTPWGSCSRCDRHPQADDRDDQHVGVVGVARFGVERREGALEPLRGRARSRSTPSQSADEEDGQHPLGALAGIGGDRLAARLQVTGGDAGLDRGLAGGREAGQRAELVGPFLDEARRSAARS